MLKELVVTIARSLVDHPDDVDVQEEEVDGMTVFTLSVHEEDIGKVIGKSGRVANAIRNVLTAANRNQGKVRLNIAD
ncbi:KH domain-containing protein [Salicibibacter halophilus]|uniref:RNA-binding protein KhpA n=1 Tax=Salicibibacter halophilus TaxID=2502791 RepID=A0A514LFE6_9BACI|nr:KH domain-containing protein [Salicibibacter halophilus]QDI90543.1 KH domain-containing protein [Salicibibacter halophilus]